MQFVHKITPIITKNLKKELDNALLQKDIKKYIKLVLEFYKEIEKNIPHAKMPSVIYLDDLYYIYKDSLKPIYNEGYEDCSGFCAHSILLADRQMYSINDEFHYTLYKYGDMYILFRCPSCNYHNDYKYKAAQLVIIKEMERIEI